ncbi:MAG TPA: tRNA (adenosine(37)-N6)-threonylcarbamoyltransferase complex ATPase subunit type 1 TsaE [Candidatus Limnocylindria bacterium]|jgi:tRNA threonylcarbamoyladenosine biosynthesis protein TsaE|nr:tRNA (adenosine(37)-N6)-threonylcarbamoyltransferase complex ATPase subunit type 1 TsaE [Candidatus Limnocylindria bacterium]
MEPAILAPDASGVGSTTGPEQTRALGRALGRAAVPGTVLALIGELGAGKTQLAKGVAEGLGVRSVVNSPTFVLMNEHAGRLRLYHVDAYRLGDPEEAIAAGLLDDRQAAGVAVVEWADRLEGWLPDGRLEISLDADGPDPEHRRISWRAFGDQHRRLAAEALPA